MRRHIKAEHQVKAARDAEAESQEHGAEDDQTVAPAAEQGESGPRGAEGSPVELALAELGIEWKDVMAFGVHSDGIVVIEGPVGYKRVYAFPGAGEVEE